MKKVSLRGIIPATVLPMTPDYKIDEDALAEYIAWVTSFRVGGIAVNVDTGEGPHLYREERKRVLEIVADTVRGRVPVIAGVPGRFTMEAVDFARDAKEAGADAVLVFPFPALSGEPLPLEIPYEYHRAIGEGADIGIVLFQLQPALGGVEYGPECLAKLTEIEQVIALKEASCDAKKFVDTVRVLRTAPRKITLLTGNDNFIFESLVLGAEGALIGFGTLATDLQVEMFELVQKGRLDEARVIADRLQPLVDVVFAPPVRNYRTRTKEALVMLGVLKSAYVRPPLLPLDKDEKQKIRDALEKADLL